MSAPADQSVTASPTVTVRAVCVVDRLLEVPGRVGVSAIDKKPVDGPVQVREYGLHGDVQADREHHGGVWKAVYLLSESEVAPWEGEFGTPVPAGFFGENLRVDGVATSELVIGTRLGLGDVDGTGLLLEITSPRVPCQTFAHRVERPRWVRRFTDEGRPGAYARVLRAGPVRAGDELRVVHVPDHGVTIRRAFVGVTPEEAARIFGEIPREQLAPSLLRKLDPATDIRPTDD